MEKLFAYGTLKDIDVQEKIFGRTLTGTPETLQGYILKEIKIEEEFGMEPYPIIEPSQNPQDSVSGMIYSLSLSELQLADTYEGKFYKRTQVALAPNQTIWVYIAKL
ncbi:gamma-glutamylcyclotransferase family protein [Flavobacterium crassostreae]|uniref:Gamma-glutamylcyclotransferase AIG2-like domain-containing protein n=1 Tax=Flavobacterium crassostreae TaxID=1763534 RepID=A0A1B9E9X5_9FLAO|nr:gamma-glutamylcyclotransferase family protein [Flavobacterium crassostreae]OCB78760.1 hypothetical protein LPBF_01845 [Flavobacterium crassostreae]